MSYLRLFVVAVLLAVVFVACDEKTGAEPERRFVTEPTQRLRTGDCVYVLRDNVSGDRFLVITTPAGGISMVRL
ncbi:MAG: hypothetical protein Q8P41_31890 [Pseudomonadota bacterium]|nr:hypothetical protein [Pseudomonadota bacterium]